MEGARFAGATLSGANIEAVLARGSDFESSDLRRAKLTYSDLSGASLVWANLEDADLEGAILEEANLNDASMINTTLTRAKLNSAQAKGVHFFGTNLSGAEMIGIIAHGSIFRDVDLTDAQLQGAYLGGTTIERTTATGVDAWHLSPKVRAWPLWEICSLGLGTECGNGFSTRQGSVPCFDQMMGSPRPKSRLILSMEKCALLSGFPNPTIGILKANDKFVRWPTTKLLKCCDIDEWPVWCRCGAALEVVFKVRNAAVSDEIAY